MTDIGTTSVALASRSARGQALMRVVRHFGDAATRPHAEDRGTQCVREIPGSRSFLACPRMTEKSYKESWTSGAVKRRQRIVALGRNGV
jgi:hypothetical protein